MTTEKRLVIFVLLGPPLGFVTFIATAVLEKFFTPPFPGFSAPILPPVEFMIWGLLVSYIAGIIPALLTCVADAFLTPRLGLWPRAGVAFCVGFALGNLVLAAATKEFPTLRTALVAGLVGAIPAAVCSWLAGRART